MKRYLLYPGCSLHSTGKAYGESIGAVFSHLGLELSELKDWNCCGATSYASIDEMEAFSLAARNLALAEQQKDGERPDLVAPCNACYLVLTKTQQYMTQYDNVRKTVDRALTEAGLMYRRSVRVRHPLDVLVNDVGLEALQQHVKEPLNGLRVACYYGCQVVRPFGLIDDKFHPTLMDRIVEKLGAEPVDWSLKTFCCGGSLTGTIPDAGLPLNRSILTEAVRRGAGVIVTCCPLCQFNLECLQNKLRARYGLSVEIPVLYFTQLMGLAFGLDDRALGMQRLFVPVPRRWRVLKGGDTVHA